MSLTVKTRQEQCNLVQSSNVTSLCAGKHGQDFTCPLCCKCHYYSLYYYLSSWLNDTLSGLPACMLPCGLKNSFSATVYGVLNVAYWSVTFILSSTVTQSDCYVSLRLPTASVQNFRTKTIPNTKNPTWNETFHFTIQSQVKVGNVATLALTV